MPFYPMASILLALEPRATGARISPERFTNVIPNSSFYSVTPAYAQQNACPIEKRPKEHRECMPPEYAPGVRPRRKWTATICIIGTILVCLRSLYFRSALAKVQYWSSCPDYLGACSRQLSRLSRHVGGTMDRYMYHPATLFGHQLRRGDKASEGMWRATNAVLFEAVIVGVCVIAWIGNSFQAAESGVPGRGVGPDSGLRREG